MKLIPLLLVVLLCVGCIAPNCTSYYFVAPYYAQYAVYLEDHSDAFGNIRVSKAMSLSESTDLAQRLNKDVGSRTSCDSNGGFR